ncbi:hypothetical protein CC78DRAFT_585308 [Lojkania enalia]|uniref:Uncharacterized protein n=1 Tax=Lojkania enalia TaxID=147567 RepID=A0A9P4N006_9PLEO|nr:hypothetical protein CC78DRAFT_585308 [Didymosphaeria enalia]
MLQINCDYQRREVFKTARICIAPLQTEQKSHHNYDRITTMDMNESTALFDIVGIGRSTGKYETTYMDEVARLDKNEDTDDLRDGPILGNFQKARYFKLSSPNYAGDNNADF